MPPRGVGLFVGKSRSLTLEMKTVILRACWEKVLRTLLDLSTSSCTVWETECVRCLHGYITCTRLHVSIGVCASVWETVCLLAWLSNPFVCMLESVCMTKHVYVYVQCIIARLLCVCVCVHACRRTVRWRSALTVTAFFNCMVWHGAGVVQSVVVCDTSLSGNIDKWERLSSSSVPGSTLPFFSVDSPQGGALK